MKQIRQIAILLIAFLLTGASPYSNDKKCKDDGRLKVALRNVPFEVESEDLEFKLYLDDIEILNEKNFYERENRFFVQTDDSHWPSGTYNAELTGLFDFDVVVNKVEIREGLVTFLTLDYQKLDSIQTNSTHSEKLIIEYDSIKPPAIWTTKCSTQPKKFGTSNK